MSRYSWPNVEQARRERNRVGVQMPEVVFRVRTQSEDGTATMSLFGELDLAGVAELQGAIERAREAGERVLVDLSELEFIDSSGLRVLVGLHNAAEAGLTDYAIVPGPPEIQRTFALCGLDRTLRFVDA